MHLHSDVEATVLVTVESSGEIETPVELEEEETKAASDADEMGEVDEVQATSEEAPATEEPAS